MNATTGLLPRDTVFFEHLEEQSATVLSGCRAFVDLVSTMRDVARVAGEIGALEEQADAIAHRMFARLHKTFTTPLDRHDLHHVTGRQDEVIDLVAAAAERLVIFELSECKPTLVALANLLTDGAERLDGAVRGLRASSSAERIIEECAAVGRIEKRADDVLRRSLVALLQEERVPVQFFKWKEVHELVEAATDRCDDVANAIEGIVLEHS